MHTRDKFIKRLENFMNITGMSYTEIGKRSVNSPTTITRMLRNNYDITTRTMDKIDKFMKKTLKEGDYKVD